MASKYELACKDTLIMRLEEAEAERDALQDQINLVNQSLDFRDIELEDANKNIKHLKAQLEQQMQENASLRSGDDYERGAE